MNPKEPHGRIARWMTELNQFHYDLQYIPGTKNVIADLFRREFDEDISDPNAFDLKNLKQDQQVI